MILDSTTRILEVLTAGSTVSLDYYCTYVDHTTSGATPGASRGNIPSATTTTIVAAPGSSTYRQVRSVRLRNRNTSAAITVTVKFDESATEYYITPDYVIEAGGTLEFESDFGWKLRDRQGRERTQALETSGYNGRSAAYLKVGTAAEAAAQWYCHSKDTGFPGAWAVGSPGLAGRATDGTAAADAGCLLIANPSTGNNYLTSYVVTSTTAHLHWLLDVVWVNSGIVVTTTTGQTINSVAFPARDINGSSNGEGYEAGLLATAAIGGGAVTNTTLTYTDSDNNSPNTATIASWPATAVIGTFVPFQLAAGDKGIRSIQTLTLGTTYSSGSLSLIVYRRIAAASAVAANIGNGNLSFPHNPGIKLYNGTCLLPFYIASATTATTTNGIISIMER